MNIKEAAEENKDNQENANNILLSPEELEKQSKLPPIAYLNASNIFKALNEKALKMSNADESKFNYKIVNSAFDGDGKNTEFVGGGQHILYVVPMEIQLASEPKFKENCLQCIKQYVTWFSGPDVANNIKLTDLIPSTEPLSDEEIKKDEDKKSDDKKPDADGDLEDDKTKDSKSEQADDNSNKEKSDDDSNNQESQTAKESLSQNNLLSLLFEKSESDNDKGKDKTQIEDETLAKDKNQRVTGYYITYKMDVGKKQTTLDKALTLIYDKVQNLKVKGKNALRNFAKFKLTFSSIFGGEISSKEYDPLKDRSTIYLDKLVSNVREYAKNKYTRLSMDLQVDDNSTLNNLLAKRITSSDKSLLSKSEYSLCIKIDKNQLMGDKIDKKIIARFINNSIPKSGESDKVSPKFKKGAIDKLKNGDLFNLVSDKDIIYFNNYGGDEKAKAVQPDTEMSPQNSNESLLISNSMMNLIFEDQDSYYLLLEASNYSVGLILKFIRDHGYKNIIDKKDTILRWVSGKERTDKTGKITQYGRIFGTKAKTLTKKVTKKRRGKEVEEKVKVNIPEKEGFYHEFFRCKDEESMIKYTKEYFNYNEETKAENKSPESTADRNAVYESLNSSDIPLKSEEPEEETIKVKVIFKDIDPEDPENDSKCKEVKEILIDNPDKIKNINSEYPKETPEHEGFIKGKWNISKDDLIDKLEDYFKDPKANEKIFDEINTPVKKESIDNNILNLLFEDNEEAKDSETKETSNEEPASEESTENNNENVKEIIIKSQYEKAKVVDVIFKDINPEDPENEAAWTDIEKLEIKKSTIKTIEYPEAPEHEGFKFTKWDKSKEELVIELEEFFKDEDDVKQESLIKLIADKHYKLRFLTEADEESNNKQFIIKPVYEAIPKEEPKEPEEEPKEPEEEPKTEEKKEIKVQVVFKDTNPEDPENEADWKDIETIEVTQNNIDQIQYPKEDMLDNTEGYQFDKWNISKEDLITQIKEYFASEENKTEEPASEEPSSEEPASEEPSSEEQTTEEPTSEEPASEENKTEEPSSEEPSSEEPASEENKTEEPASEESTSEEQKEKPKEETQSESLIFRFNRSLIFEDNEDETNTEQKTDEQVTSQQNSEEQTTEEPASEEPASEEQSTEDNIKQFIVLANYKPEGEKVKIEFLMPYTDKGEIIKSDNPNEIGEVVTNDKVQNGVDVDNLYISVDDLEQGNVPDIKYPELKLQGNKLIEKYDLSKGKWIPSQEDFKSEILKAYKENGENGLKDFKVQFILDTTKTAGKSQFDYYVIPIKNLVLGSPSSTK